MGQDGANAAELEELVSGLEDEGETSLLGIAETREGVLVIDPAPDEVRALADLLSREGLAVHGVPDAEGAVLRMGTHLPELILMELDLPGQDGIELCRQLKGTPRTEQIPVLFLCGSTREGERLRCFEAGAVDILVRPFLGAELSARVRTHLELARHRAGLEERLLERTTRLKTAVLRLAEEASERSLLENAFRKSERRYKHLVENVPLGVYQLTATGNFRYANRGLLRQLGCRDRDEFLGRCYEFGPLWEEPEELARFLEEARLQGGLEDWPVRLRLPGGVVRTFRHWVVRDPREGTLAGISVPEMRR